MSQIIANMPQYQAVVCPLISEFLLFDCDQGQSWEEKTRCSVHCLIIDLALGECRLCFVMTHGITKLTDQIILYCFDKCRGMKFEYVQFEVPHGTPATRHAKFVRTSRGLDRYEADLTDSDVVAAMDCNPPLRLIRLQ